jgi:hypothetical protein
MSNHGMEQKIRRGPSEPCGGRGRPTPPQILTDTLTLSNRGGGGHIMPTTLLLVPLRIFRSTYTPEEEEPGFKGKATLMKNSIENYPPNFQNGGQILKCTKPPAGRC